MKNGKRQDAFNNRDDGLHLNQVWRTVYQIACGKQHHVHTVIFWTGDEERELDIFKFPSNMQGLRGIHVKGSKHLPRQKVKAII